jgi:hypothetical protein
VYRRSKYHSQACHLVRPHQSFCLRNNTRTGHPRNKSRTCINRLNFLWFLNLVFLIVFLFLFLFWYKLTLSSLFSYLYSHPLHSPSFSCTTIHCSFSQIHFLSLHIHSSPSLTPPSILPQPVTTQILLTIHLPLADKPTVPTVYNHSPLQSLTKTPSTSTTEIHSNIHKSHKIQQSQHLLVHPSTPFPAPPF